jgi:hypothetical protein
VIVGRHDDAKERLHNKVSDAYNYVQLGRALVAAGEDEHDQALVHLRVAANHARVSAVQLMARDLLVTVAALALLRGDARRASRLLAVERDSLGATALPRAPGRAPPTVGSPSSWALYLHVRDRVRHILTRDERLDCIAQAASLTVDTALAAELGDDAWPLER